MSDSYLPYIRPVEGRDKWIKTATYDELREAYLWAVAGRNAAQDEIWVFGLALEEAIDKKTIGYEE